MEHTGHTIAVAYIRHLYIRHLKAILCRPFVVLSVEVLLQLGLINHVYHPQMKKTNKKTKKQQLKIKLFVGNIYQ